MASDRGYAGRDVLVDSNVILDVLTEDPKWFEWSSSRLAELAAQLLARRDYSSLCEAADGLPGSHFGRLTAAALRVFMTNRGGAPHPHVVEMVRRD